MAALYDLKIKKESYRSGNMDKLLRMRYIRSCLSLRAGWMSTPGPFQPCISTLLCVCLEVSSYFPTRDYCCCCHTELDMWSQEIFLYNISFSNLRGLNQPPLNSIAKLPLVQEELDHDYVI